MSAGEFFELVRPAFLILSALLSTLILVSARRNGFRAHSSLIWALATLFLPLVVIPLFLIVRTSERRRTDYRKSRRDVRARLLLPILYLVTLLALIGLSEYRDYNGIDAHLARATQARVAGDRERTIQEYRDALALEDNAHTHKLLGIELNNGGDWTEALSEFRLAEKGKEPDQSLPFRIAVLLDSLNQRNQATFEFKRFLYSEACLKVPVDYRCEAARRRVTDDRSDLR